MKITNVSYVYTLSLLHLKASLPESASQLYKSQISIISTVDEFAIKLSIYIPLNFAKFSFSAGPNIPLKTLIFSFLKELPAVAIFSWDYCNKFSIFQEHPTLTCSYPTLHKFLTEYMFRSCPNNFINHSW